MLQFNFIVIPLITITIALCGSYYTSHNLVWYQYRLRKPKWTPPGSLIGAVWTILYILATISALAVWNTFPRNPLFYTIITTFLINAVLNFLWSYLFFGKQKVKPALYEAGALALSVLILIFLIWPMSPFISALLIPYFLWVSFATYLTYSIWKMNWS